MYPQPEIQSRDIRVNLPQCYAAYWRQMSFRRHVGYQKRRGLSYWVARDQTKTHTYRQKRIGIADDIMKADGEAVLTFD